MLHVRGSMKDLARAVLSGSFFFGHPLVVSRRALRKIQDGFTKGTRLRAGLHWNETRNIKRYFVESSARKGLEKNSQIPPKFAQISKREETRKLSPKLLISELELDIII